MLDHILIAQQVRYALDEDIGSGDLTANLIPDHELSTATILSRENMVLCGIPWVNAVFKQLDAELNINWYMQDGDNVNSGALVCTLYGSSRALLTGERTALNFLQTLSATATLARRYVDTVAGTGVRILDTRKTIPGLRVAQKYAVLCGGGSNHRRGLFDAILIKENHIQAAGSIAKALEIAQRQSPGVEIEVEVESLEELHQALSAGAKRILLDNFNLIDLQAAVATAKAYNVRLEASGGVDLHTVRAIANTGVNDISIGEITKNIRAIDLSMRII